MLLHRRASPRAILVAAFAALLLVGAARPAPAYDPANGDFARESASHIRVLTYNTLRNFIASPSRDDEFQRIVEAINPDVIAFQEIDADIASPAATIKARLESYAIGGTWTVNTGTSDTFVRNALASRLGLSLQSDDTTPGSDVRGVTSGLVNLPGTPDLYVMCSHFKSGGGTDNNMRRQIYADAVVNWMRDARTPGGGINLPTGTPMLLVGDLNVGFDDEGDERPYHIQRTLRTGDIFDEATFGGDSPPDWDGSDNSDAAPYEHTTGDADTHSSASSDPLSRLDRFYYTDSVIHVANRFILNTSKLSPAALAAAGLNAGDTSTAADHLPCVVDFALGPDPLPPARLLINEFLYNDIGTDSREFVEFINTGGRPLNLDAPNEYFYLRSANSLPTSSPGAENQDRYFELKGVVPPGGLFVLYDRAGASVDLTSTIESNLPAPQRQNDTNFSLFNGPNAGIALVARARANLAGTTTVVFEDTPVDAYLYENNGAGTTYFFRTDSDNALVIPLAGGQLSSTSIVTDTQSHSRNVGDFTPNSFGGWTNPDTATPGLPNATAPIERAFFWLR